MPSPEPTPTPTSTLAPTPMSAPVHALAHCPLTPAAVAEFLALPEQPAPADDFDALDTVLRARGWGWEHDCLTDSFRTGFGHPLCTEGDTPFGDPEARSFLVFGELYPLDPDDEDLVNMPWLGKRVDDWGSAPGWTVRRPSTLEECVEVLDRATDAVSTHLGPVSEVPPAPRRPARALAALSGHPDTTSIGATLRLAIARTGRRGARPPGGRRDSRHRP